MSIQILRFSTAVEQVPQIEEAIRKLFAAVEDAAPDGVEYTAGRVGDGPEFLLSLNLADGEANPLLAIPEALEFRNKVAEWTGAPVPPQPFTVLGQYTP